MFQERNSINASVEEYLRAQRIQELFEDICTNICYQRPEDVKAFIVQQLQQKQQHGFKNGYYSTEEVNAVFTLFDLKKEGEISGKACKTAIETLASSSFQFSELQEADIPHRVSRERFVELCSQLVGIN